MVFSALLMYVDQLGTMMTSARDSLAEQIGNLQELQRWTIASVQGVQQRADAAIQKLDAERKKLEAERVKLQGTQELLQTNAVQAIHDAVRRQSGDIREQTVEAFSRPLRDIEHAADYVRKNIREVKWLTIGLVLSAGVLIGLLAGYFFVVRTQNAMDDRLDRIEQTLAAQQQPVQTPAAIDPKAPGHKPKAK